jgi:hypothetical protein
LRLGLPGSLPDRNAILRKAVFQRIENFMILTDDSAGANVVKKNRNFPRAPANHSAAFIARKCSAGRQPFIGQFPDYEKQ